jgi:hypothetical protein
VATAVSSLLTQARRHLNETTATFWSDAELVDLCNKGIHDLWRRINDLYQHYFITIDSTNVTLAASSSALAGVPSDVFRVVTIEPRVLGGSNPNPGLIFKPRDYNHPDFVQARGEDAIEPLDAVLYYTLFSAGPPVSAPTIRVAPQVTSAVNLTLVYNQVLAAVTASSDNPIPGQSDNALIAWMVAYARAKERDDTAPDPEWLAIYGTEKVNLVTQLTPRTIQEPTYAEGMFEGWD